MARSTGCACRTSILPASLPPFLTTRKGAVSASPRRAETSAVSSSTGRTVRSSLHGSWTRTVSANSKITCRSPAQAGGRTSWSAEFASSAARCHFTWSVGLPSTTPEPLTKLHLGSGGARFDGPGMSLELVSSVPLRSDGSGVVADFTLKEGENVAFVLRRLQSDDASGRCPGVGEAEDLFRDTVAFWRRWLAKSTYSGRWREMVHRSAMTLKLLSFQPTGAIVAAPTCSLPESIGGVA